jgi:hypothetical protein
VWGIERATRYAEHHRDTVETAVSWPVRGGRESVEYKVLTKEDRRWSGKFSPENLERTLNSYAAEGWRVVSSVPMTSPWSLSTSQVIVVLERETPAG